MHTSAEARASSSDRGLGKHQAPGRAHIGDSMPIRVPMATMLHASDSDQDNPPIRQALRAVQNTQRKED